MSSSREPVVHVLGMSHISDLKLSKFIKLRTSCPMELRMKRTNSAWRCTVSIQCIYDEYGMPLGQAQTIAFGNPIFKQEEVEERVRRAQRAILSPSTPPEEFVNNSYTISATELSFSKNYISIQIEGPNVPDLSLVDLPGNISVIPHLYI